MGTDDLFHKRKARKARELARRQARRDSYARVLIVCEGEKTEPHYFNDLKDHYELNSANVEVCGDCASDPLSIFAHARQRFREAKEAGIPFDRVFCVFDKDTHTNYKPALDAIRSATPKDVFVAITSVPCFEYWLLLHFNYTTKPYYPLPGKSACHQVMTDLKGYMESYTKGNLDTFSALVGQLAFAKVSAARALKAAKASQTDNPTTYVHELVEFLQNIKGRPVD